MNAFHLLKMELSKLKGQKGVLFSVLGVLLIPIVYVAVLLSSTWGPYDYLNNLPVAFVNNDQGALSGETPINVGKDLVADLKESNTLGWDFVTKEEAEKGLDKQDYYMVIEIPEDFSQKVTTVLDANPQVPELRYIQNEGLNFMAAQVTKSATEKIREQLGNKITETYTRTLFSKFGEISTGFASGADGSQKIFEGTTSLSDGTSLLLTSLTDKTDDILKLASGAQSAESGAGELLRSINAGTTDINKLAAGSRNLANGVTTLKEGSVKVLGGLQAANAGSESVTSGLETKLKPGSEQIANGMSKVAATTSQLSGGSQSLTAGLMAYLEKHPELNNDQEFMTLLGTSDAISKGMVQFNQEVQPLKVGAAELAGGISQAATGSKQVSEGLSQLVAGQTTATAGIDQLQAGANQVANGNASVASSWTKLSSGVSSLQNGLTQISAGNQTVATGWETMTLGVTSLDTGAKQLQTGSKELSTGLAGGADEVSSIQVTDANIAMFSNPVTLSGETVNGLNYYRDSTAPYILSLALFVGILILSFFVDFKQPIVMPGSAISWYASKLMNLSIFAIAQGLLVSLFALFFLQLQVESVFSFILFSIFTSLTFLAIVFFLVAFGGNVGRFVAFAFLVLQLSLTGSNLPIPMLPENLQAISKFLPLTYSNAGFKSIISLGDTSFLLANVFVLFMFMVVFTVLTLAVFIYSYSRGREKIVLAI